MPKRLADTEIWNKDWFIDLNIKQKLLIKFLFDNCDCAGFYEISYRNLKNCFGEEIKKEDFAELKQVKFISENKVFIEDFIQFQYGVSINELNEKNNVHKGILKSLNKNNVFSTLNQPLINPCLRVLDKDKDKDMDKVKDKDNNLSFLVSSFLSEKNAHLLEEAEKEAEKENCDEEIEEHIEPDENNDKLPVEIMVEKLNKKTFKDPYELYSSLKEVYEEITEKKCYLSNPQITEKLYPLYAQTDDFIKTFPDICMILKALQDVWGKKLNFSPGLSWLIDSDKRGKSNYVSVRDGTYKPLYNEWRKNKLEME